MLSIEALTVIAYLGDGFIVCRACGEKRNMLISDSLCEYNLGEWSEGCYCNDCDAEIIEPWFNREDEGNA